MPTVSAASDPLLYLDANVFMYPVLHSGRKADAAAALLAAVETGLEPCATSALTIDEVVWVLTKHTGREVALRTAEIILGLPGLKILPVREPEVRRSLDLMRDVRKLAPRDALHAACALQAGIHTIVSDDEDFERVPKLSRRALA